MAEGNFFANTRLVTSRLEPRPKPSGGGVVRWTLPKVGFLAGVMLLIRGSISGTLSNLNPYGKAGVIRRVQLTTNAGIDIVNISGPGYHYLLSEAIERELHLPAAVDARNAVATGPFTLDMWLPVALNLQSQLGLLLLQNEQTQVTLTVDFEADSAVATSATVTATVEPVLFYYLVPQSPDDFPALDTLHTILEDSQAVSGAGQVTVEMPRGNVYVAVMHGMGIGANGDDLWSRFQVRIGMSQYPYDITPPIADVLHYLQTGRARPLGGIFVNYLALSGQGHYSAPVNLINSGVLTNYDHLIQATVPTTLHTVREQLVVLGG